MAAPKQVEATGSKFVSDELLDHLYFRPQDQARQQRARRSQDQIVTAALHSFMEKGFDGISTHEIAEEAEVTQGLITYHFKSKEGLWQAAMDRFFGDFRNELAKRIEELNDIDDPLFFKLIIRHIVKWPSRYPFVVQFMSDTGRQQQDGIAWIVDRHIRPIYDVIQAIFDLGKARGIVRDLPTLNLYFLIMTASSVFALKHEINLLTGDDVDSIEFVERQTETIVKLILES